MYNYTTSYQGICFIAKEEACVYIPYEDGPYLSIGFGHNGPDVISGMVIDLTKALDLLKQDLQIKENIVNKLIKKELSQSEFDALVSLAYNKGSVVKNVIEFINSDRKDEAIANLLTYNRDAHGVFRMGLAGRRQREANIFAHGDYGDLSKVLVFSGPPKTTKPTSIQFPTEDEFKKGEK